MVYNEDNELKEENQMTSIEFRENTRLAMELAKAIAKYGEECMEEAIKLYNGNVRTAIKAIELYAKMLPTK